MMIVAIVVFFLVCLYILKIEKKRELRPPLASGAIPILGHAVKALTNPEEIFNYLTHYTMESIERDAPVTIRMFISDVYLVTHPADALTVINSCLKKDVIYDYIKPWIGEGLITSTGKTWHKHRKLLSPTFNQTVLDSYLSELNKQARSLVTRLEAKVGKEKFNHAPYLEHATLESLCSTAMGIIMDKEDVELREQYLRAKSEFSRGVVTRAQTFWLHSDFIYNLSSLKKIQTDLANTLRRLTNTVLKKRREEFRQIKLNNEKRFKPFMEHLLDMENDGVLSDKEIQEEVDTFTFAGSDTTAVALTTTLLVVGSYPNVQKKIAEELGEVFQGSQRDVEKQDLLQLKYLEAVLKESLRLYPSSPIIGRTMENNVKIRDYTLPAGSRCYVSLYGVNRHPSWGPDADQFRPERWLDPTPPSQQLATFGLGKRRCIGSTFALMSMKTMLAHVLRHYRVSGDVTELVRAMEVVARPVPKDYIALERRTQTQ